MKRLLPALFLLLTAAALLANDSGSYTYPYPSYQELVREGFAPRTPVPGGTPVAINYSMRATPKPTQVYHGNGYTIYYGFTTVMVPIGEADKHYAFGVPLSYFRQLMPKVSAGTDLSRYAVELRDPAREPVDYMAQSKANRARAITMVRKVTPAKMTAATAPAATSPLPPVGEKQPR